MKRLGQILGGLLAVVLTVASVQAAERLAGRDFNHMATGFPLSGGHATAPCETCHVGGVFKGTPRNCDGCHAVGKRVLATPKSNAHVVTDAPCESCHFNTSTWFGARYNHGTAAPGQCKTCHGGRQAAGKPASHNAGSKATASCDSCHRSSSWLPASWNHIGVAPGTCATCHNGATATGKTPSHTTSAMATFQCDRCHSFSGWLPAGFKHSAGDAGQCRTCHATTPQPGSHTNALYQVSCDSCHRTTAWLPATFSHTGVAPGTCATCHNGIDATGKTGTHTTTAKATWACDACHTTRGWLPAQYTHTSGAACSSCHNGTFAVGKNAGHIATTEECNVCHTSTTTWLGALGAMPSNHIPFNTGTTCGSCHIGTSVVRGPTLHSYLTSKACTTCHLRNNPYAAWGQETKSLGHEGWSTGDCSQSGCHRPLGNRGTSYINWD